jgi:DNA-binding transcriptional LysR family regulator
MELRQLRYFAAVSRLRNFTRAAAELHVTQPTVTTAVRNLENELGVDLIDRVTCTPTSAGEELLRRSESIFRNLDIIREEIQAGSFGREQLTLAIPPISCSAMYPVILNEFAGNHPEIDLRIRDICNGEVLHHLLGGDGELDAGFVVGSTVESPNVGYLDLAAGTLNLLVSTRHPLAKKSTVDFADLAHERILMYAKGTSYTELRIEREMNTRGIPYHVSEYFNNISTIFDLVSQNYGISFVMDTTSPSLTHVPGTMAISFTDPLTYRIGLMWNRSGEPRPCLRQLIAFIRKYYGA